MKKYLIFLLILSLALGCSNDSDIEEEFTLTKFELPKGCDWKKVDFWGDSITIDKLYVINSVEELETYMDHPYREFNVDFHKETIFYVIVCDWVDKAIAELSENDGNKQILKVTYYLSKEFNPDILNFYHLAVRVPKSDAVPKLIIVKE